MPIFLAGGLAPEWNLFLARERAQREDQLCIFKSSSSLKREKMIMDSSLFHLQLISCALMTGLIWTIQILHYPAFLSVRDNDFHLFHQSHTRRITYLVGPMMLLELITGAILWWRWPEIVLLKINIILIALIWIATALLSVPLHNKLSENMNRHVILRLIQTNWVRTILWSVRLALLFYLAEFKSINPFL